MRLICDFMQDAAARAALGVLTQATFGFDFEAWVARGFYVPGAYVPYSFEEDGRILSNVSVNRMDFCLNGEKRRWLQLGTVATREDMRGRGLARRLMEIALADSGKDSDGVYLFANPDATGFYEKCGFVRGNEYRYPLRAQARPETAARFVPVDSRDAKAWAAYQRAVRETEPYAALWQENGYGLAMFHTMNAESVWFCPAMDAYAVVEDGCLNAVFARKMPPLRAVLAALDASEGVQAPSMLGFTPRAEDADMCACEPWYGGAEYRLYGLGGVTEEIMANRLCFPALSHA